MNGVKRKLEQLTYEILLVKSDEPDRMTSVMIRLEELTDLVNKLLIPDVMCNFDNLIDKLVSEVRKYFEFNPNNRTPFNDDFPQKMKNEWKGNIEELIKLVEYYEYLNKKRREGVIM
jgi:hypothetical protein